jgi:signal transduction histidine kinase
LNELTPEPRFIATKPIERTIVEVRKTLLRIAQEAISNALRHGHARHVRVALDFRRESTSLSALAMARCSEMGG